MRNLIGLERRDEKPFEVVAEVSQLKGVRRLDSRYDVPEQRTPI
jgi:hypothetical protein